MPIKIKLHGHLHWYAGRQKELEVNETGKNIEEILEVWGIPIGEVFMVVKNQVQVDLASYPMQGDLIEVYPVVGGG